MTNFERFPQPRGDKRRKEAKRRRDLATQLSFDRPQTATEGRVPPTLGNGEELFSRSFAMNFTKGLKHNKYGIIEQPSHYARFVDAINTLCPVGSSGDFIDRLRDIAPDPSKDFKTQVDGRTPDWRGWESPRAGHAYDLQGPDADAFCMPPAPRASSDELAVEMIEVYGMALFRDVPFSEFADAKPKSDVSGYNGYTLDNLLANLSDANWHQTKDIKPPAEQARREARRVELGSASLFRGSSPGCMDGPYISQFLLVGTKTRKTTGVVGFGAQSIDQKVFSTKKNLDYMSNWNCWLDVQNGANYTEKSDRSRPDIFEQESKFIATPRDLATYVHIDQLYQAYLVAALIMLEEKYPLNPGFPSGDNSKTMQVSDGRARPRGSFATFGGPHLLALLTEVSSRGLRAVRRQKFNYHRRARPEVMGGRLTLAANQPSELRDAELDFATLLAKLPIELRTAINARNADVITNDGNPAIVCPANPSWITENLLLPMAFPEGSPMHPAYGAGHATVAGACVTILKLFFDMFEEPGSTILRAYPEKIYEATVDGTSLKSVAVPKDTTITIAGELNKLAANISIGRNMAGVHYYSDYYDSVRLGERIAVGIAQEQMTNYPDSFELRFPSFDGEIVTILGGGCKDSDFGLPKVFIGDGPDKKEANAAWWLCDRTLALNA